MRLVAGGREDAGVGALLAELATRVPPLAPLGVLVVRDHTSVTLVVPEEEGLAIEVPVGRHVAGRHELGATERVVEIVLVRALGIRAATELELVRATPLAQCDHPVLELDGPALLVGLPQEEGIPHALHRPGNGNAATDALEPDDLATRLGHHHGLEALGRDAREHVHPRLGLAADAAGLEGRDHLGRGLPQGRHLRQLAGGPPHEAATRGRGRPAVHLPAQVGAAGAGLGLDSGHHLERIRHSNTSKS